MKALDACAFLVITAALCLPALGATQYVIANDNNSNRSNLLVYKLNTATGLLTQIAELPTGGEAWGPGFDTDFANVQQAVSPGASCIFAMDGRSNDIAAFSSSTGYSKVGNYSNGAVTGGVSLALSPNGEFLYGSYLGDNNIGAWMVNSDCSLTFVAAYIPGGDIPGPIKVTPNGKYLVAGLRSGAELYTIDNATGALTDNGFLSFANNCPDFNLCGADGLDFTKDSKFVVFAGSYSDIKNESPIAMMARISPSGLTRLRGWSLKNAAHIGDGQGENFVPFFSAAGYGGSGSLYFGLGDGIITANFSESPLKITVVNATSTVFAKLTGAAIAVTGNMLVQAQYPNQLLVYSVNSDGSLTQLSTTTLKNPIDAMFSFSIFPNTR